MRGILVSNIEATLRDMLVATSHDGVVVSGATGVRITESLFLSRGDRGLVVTGSTAVRVSDSVITSDSSDPAMLINDSVRVSVRGCLFSGTATCLAMTDAIAPSIVSNEFTSGVVGILSGGSYLSDGIISTNTFYLVGSAIDVNGASNTMINGNMVVAPDTDGIVATDSSDCRIAENQITFPGGAGDNTYDGIRLQGDSNRNHVTQNKITARQSGNTTRYGINISASTCDCNVVVDNSGSDPADFGTDALVNDGTDTWLSIPVDATYGQNAFGCPV